MDKKAVLADHSYARVERPVITIRNTHSKLKTVTKPLHQSTYGTGRGSALSSFRNPHPKLETVLNSLSQVSPGTLPSSSTTRSTQSNLKTVMSSPLQASPGTPPSLSSTRSTHSNLKTVLNPSLKASPGTPPSSSSTRSTHSNLKTVLNSSLQASPGTPPMATSSRHTTQASCSPTETLPTSPLHISPLGFQSRRTTLKPNPATPRAGQSLHISQKPQPASATTSQLLLKSSASVSKISPNGGSSKSVKLDRISLEPFQLLILVCVFRDFPVFYQRTHRHYRCPQNGTCKLKKEGALKILSLVRAQEQEALCKGTVKTAALNGLIAKYENNTGSPFAEIKRRFHAACKTACEQLEMVEATGNTDRFTMGYFQTWKQLYAEWFKAACASGNFGFGRLPGEKFDQECPDRDSILTPKRHRAPIVLPQDDGHHETSLARSPGPPIRRKAPADIARDAQEDTFPFPAPKKSTALPKSSVPALLESAQPFIAASLRKKGEETSVETVIRLYQLIMKDILEKSL